MERTPGTDTPATQGRRSKPSARPARYIAAVYFVLAIVGLVGTWYYNLQFSGDNELAAWFVNAASASAAVDLIVILMVASVFFLREGLRLG